MTAQTSRPLVPALGLAQVAVLLWIAWQVTFSDAARPAPPPTVSTADELGELCRELAELNRVLKTRSMSVPSGGESRETPKPAPRESLDAPAVVEAIERLREDLRRLSWRGGANSVAALPSTRPEPQWQEIAAFHERLTSDYKGVRQHLLLTPAADILTRFGKPTSVAVDGTGRTIWLYERRLPAANGESTRQRVRFYFHDGLLFSVDG